MAQDNPDVTTRPPSPFAAPDRIPSLTDLPTPTLPAPAFSALSAPTLPTLPLAAAAIVPTAGPYAPAPGALPAPYADSVSGYSEVAPPTRVGQRNVVVQTPSRSHRRVRRRSELAIAGVVLSMATGTYAAIVVLQQRQELVRIRDRAAVDGTRIADLDDRLELATLVAAGGLVIGGLFFLIWFHRAYRNIKTMGRNRFTPGWSIASWFIPLLNLVRPYQMMKELTTESHRHRPLYPPNTVGLWWATVLINVVLDRVLAQIDTNTVGELIMWDTIRPIAGVLWVVSGGLLITLIVRVTKAQDAWFDEPAALPASIGTSVQQPQAAYPG